VEKQLISFKVIWFDPTGAGTHDLLHSRWTR